MPFLRNAWYMGLWAQDLPERSIISRMILTDQILFYRNSQGRPVALQDVCPHRLAPLSAGRLLPNGGIACPYHGLEFNEYGQCVHNPHGGSMVRKRAQVVSYPAVERDSIVWVWPGDRAPDLASLPDFSFLDPANSYQISRRDCIRMPADYWLMVSNLLDLSHVPYLHSRSFSDGKVYDTKVEVRSSGSSVEVSRTTRDTSVTPIAKRILKGAFERGDLTNCIRWTAPSSLVNDTMISRSGGERSEGAGILTAHILTPESEFSTNYYIAAAIQKSSLNLPPVDEESMNYIADIRRHAFEVEDGAIIVAQAENMKRFPALAAHPLWLDIDAGPAQAQRILEKLIQEEANAS